MKAVSRDSFKKSILKNFYYFMGCDCLLCCQKLSTDDAFFAQFQLPLCQHCYEELQKEKLGTSFTKDHYEVVALFEYKGLAKRLIHQAKYHHCPFSAQILIEIANEFFLSQKEKGDFVFIPIPCSFKSKKERGWDPVTLWAKKLKNRNSDFLVASFLKRRSNQIFQPQQKKLNREKRLEMASFRYQIDKAAIKKHQDLFKEKNLPAKKYILLDDVMTTGATLKEAMHLLEDFSPTAWVLFVD